MGSGKTFCLPIKVTAFQISSVLLCLSGNLRDNKKDTFNYDYFWRRSVTAAVSADLMCHLIGKPSEDIFITSPLQDIAGSLSSVYHGEQRAETIEMIFSTLREKYSLKTAQADELIDTIAGRPVEKPSFFEIPPGGLKPFSQILQEADADINPILSVFKPCSCMVKSSMILSFNPIIVADQNRICAGRQPDQGDLEAIRAARAVILGPGCYESLYRMARANCPHVFPNMDVRFDHPGKRNQIRLFRSLGVAHPPTRLFDTVAGFEAEGLSMDYPLVLKLDWGGEGKTVFKAADPARLDQALDFVRACEGSGQCGFLIQRYIPGGRRCLRVVVIGDRVVSYWRVQKKVGAFGTAVTGGAAIDHRHRPELQAAARTSAARVCGQTGLQLAGFDYIFDRRALEGGQTTPLLLEINFFFGRSGLGGSQGYYRMFEQAVDRWLDGLNLGLE